MAPSAKAFDIQLCGISFLSLVVPVHRNVRHRFGQQTRAHTHRHICIMHRERVISPLAHTTVVLCCLKGSGRSHCTTTILPYTHSTRIHTHNAINYFSVLSTMVAFFYEPNSVASHAYVNTQSFRVFSAYRSVLWVLFRCRVYPCAVVVVVVVAVARF